MKQFQLNQKSLKINFTDLLTEENIDYNTVRSRTKATELVSYIYLGRGLMSLGTWNTEH
jgi:hypothetical protein